MKTNSHLFIIIFIQMFFIHYASSQESNIYQLNIDSCHQNIKELKPNIDWIVISNNLSFQMGDLWGIGKPNEKPIHNVVLSPYQIGKYEITNYQYVIYLNQAMTLGIIDLIGGNIISKENNKVLIKLSLSECQIRLTDFGVFKPLQDKDNHPVVCVTWYGAHEFAKFYGWRLPTEAEWERTAKGTNNKWSWGNTLPNCDLGNFLGCNTNSTQIGKYKSGISQDGCYDLAGNVWEWCQDWMGNYPDTIVENPTGPSEGIRKVERGGCWPNDIEFIRTTFRGSRNPNEANAYVGFRVVKSK